MAGLANEGGAMLMDVEAPAFSDKMVLSHFLLCLSNAVSSVQMIPAWKGKRKQWAEKVSVFRVFTSILFSFSLSPSPILLYFSFSLPSPCLQLLSCVSRVSAQDT